MRFLVDMNLSPDWVPLLTDDGHQAIHWMDVGSGDAPDRDLMDYAATNSYVILTQDLDFGTMLAIGALATPSVIQFRTQRVLPKQIGQTLLSAVRAAEADLAAGALLTIEPARQRVTVLPLVR